MTIEQKVKEIAKGIYQVEVTDETKLESIGDDEDRWDFVLSLEDEFDIDISEENEHIDTIQGFIDLVTNLKGV